MKSEKIVGHDRITPQEAHERWKEKRLKSLSNLMESGVMSNLQAMTHKELKRYVLVNRHGKQ